MTKRHTRLFFIGGTALFALVFLGMTLDSHRQFDRLTNADRITEDVKAGKDVWHHKNCINCHTLLGEGAYFAPELANVMTRWGVADDPEAAFEILKGWMESQPSQIEGRRQMPQFNLTDEQIRALAAFLLFVDEIDAQGWPPNEAG